MTYLKILTNISKFFNVVLEIKEVNKGYICGFPGIVYVVSDIETGNVELPAYQTGNSADGAMYSLAVLLSGKQLINTSTGAHYMCPMLDIKPLVGG